MTVSPVYGPMIGADEVEAAVTDTLKLWLPTYLAELERRTGRAAGSLPLPKSWATTNSFSQDQGDQLPAAIVVSPGTVDTPERRGDGRYSCWWEIRVAIIVTSTTKEDANALAKLYAKAVRSILIQKPSLGDFADSVEWVGESNEAAPADFLQIGWVTESGFNVWTTDVATAFAGPPDADVLDPAPSGTVQTTDLEITKETLT